MAKKPPPKPKAWVTINTLQGDSSTKTDEFTVPRGAKARLVYSMPGDGNNAITLYKTPKESSSTYCSTRSGHSKGPHAFTSLGAST